MSISSKKVASRAGVSQATVSRVINNRANVSPATRLRVLDAIKEFGYYPNAAARSLVTNQASKIGFVVSDVFNPAYLEFVEEISVSARGFGYQILFCNVQRESEAEEAYVQLLIEQRVAGVIFSAITRESVVGQRLTKVGIPFVYLNRRQQGVAAHAVVSDGFAGARLMTRHLIELGHRRIAFMRGVTSASTSEEREWGFRSLMAEQGLAVDEALVVTGAFGLSQAYAAALELLERPERPTAIFCANDYMALGVLDAAYDLGLRVPEDLSLTGYDNMRLAALRPIDLTTVEQPFVAMARKAMDILQEAITSGNTLEPQQIIYPPQLIVRRSSGPVPTAQ